MENVNLPSQIEDQNAMRSLLENLSMVLKDSDAVEEKAMVKRFLQEDTADIAQIKMLLQELEQSVDLRKRQYQADAVVLRNIDSLMDGFREKSREEIDFLKKEIQIEIDEVVNSYQNEILQRLDAKNIKERFQYGKDEFMEYIEFVNESYQRRMSDEIGKRIVGYIRIYLAELQDVFEEATGYFRTRESLLTLENKFYGTLATSKSEMIKKTSNQFQEIKEYHNTIMEAAEEMFIKVWDAREKADQNVKISTSIGTVAGATAGSVATGLWATNGTIAGFLAQYGLVKTAVMVATYSTMLVPIATGVLVTGVAANKIAKKIATVKNTKDLEAKMNVYIEEFKSDISDSKMEIKEQILESVEQIFVKELNHVDKAFANFRMSVNIDSKNIPLLEERMEYINDFVMQIKQIEGIQG